jgi:hypothetical protein
MVDVPFVSFAFDSTLGTAARTMPSRLDDVINVKDFGATGDGSTDDTAAIQAALDAAFGPWASPHATANVKSNRAVWFPGGAYLVRQSLAAKTVSGAATASGNIRLTLNNTTGLANGDIVYVRAVGGVPNANLSYTIKDVDSTHITLVKSAFGGTYTSGGTVRPPCLRIKDVYGGKIFGAGKGSTKIFTDSTDCALFSVNGFLYSTVSDIEFGSDARGIAFDLNGDGLGLMSQSCLLSNCSFGGSASVNGDYACTVGMGQEMGSEMTFLNCYVATGTKAGLAWFNFNALAGTVIGGNFAIGGNPSAGVVGILVNAGACPIIHGVSFQNKEGTDIYITNGAGDAYCITGCRTESDNFVNCPVDVTLFIGGCSQANSGTTTAYFYTGSGRVTIDGCSSTMGANKYISGGNASMIIRNVIFDNADYWYGGAGENYNYLEITPQPEIEITSTTYSTQSRDGGCKLRFNNASPVTVTVTKQSDNSNRLFTGSFIDVQQTGAGKVTFQGSSGVTINSRGGLKSLNGQYAVGRLVCDGADAWSLSGDIVA